MADYSYLFNYGKIYSENILSFYNLFNSDDITELISSDVLENPFFLYLIYPSRKIVRQLLIKDELIRFKFIDFFTNNIDLIEQREIKINNFLLTSDIEHLDNILKQINTDIDINKINYLKPVLDDIIVNRDIYLHYILCNSWSGPDKYESINIENLSIRLIILFYFRHFFIKNRSYNLKIDDPDYIEFSRLLIKYNNLYNINLDYTDIVFKKDVNSNIFSSQNEYLLIYFFNTLTNPNLITKNVIAWFYIFFSSKIPENLHNEILYIIFDMSVKKNTIGLITYILKSFNKDYNKFSEDEKNDIIKQIKNDYIYKENEIISNKINIENYINNLILLRNLSDNNKKFELLNITNLDNNIINKNNLFFILNCDPLIETWTSVLNKIEKIETKFQNLDFPIVELRKLYNSIIYTDFNDKDVHIINNQGKYISQKFENSIEDYIFDKEILFYNFLLFLNNFEIIIFDKETSLINIIRSYNTDINTIKNIFFSLKPFKDFYNGYKGLK